MTVPEMFFDQCQVALLESVSTKTVLRRIKAGEYGPLVTREAARFFVPASAINARRERHRVFDADGRSRPIVARSIGELRRKAALQHASAA